MNVKEAARTAKEYLVDLFDGEGIMDVGLEEVEFDDASEDWKITIGFSRPWDRRVTLGPAFGPEERPARSYKVVCMDELGRLKSVTDRVLPTSGS